MLERIVKTFQNSRNIREKRKITSIVETLIDQGYTSEQVYASFGEDAAAIRPNPKSDELILITTDAILPEFVQKSPYGAGFSSIYVGIDDIMACGGHPLACSTILSYPDDELGQEVFRGILDATHVFRTPLVRGHTTTDAQSIALSSTVIGNTTVNQFLSAGGAQNDDTLGIIWDQEGEPGKANPKYWNTILMKNSKEFFHKRSFLAPCIEKKYIHACKDISNGGILGTLYQMLEYSGKGAHIELDNIEALLTKDKFVYALFDFLFLFLTSGFLVSIASGYEKNVENYCNTARMRFYPLGKIVKSNVIKLKYQNQEKNLISDFFIPK